MMPGPRIIHRDFKLVNIMRDARGVVRLLDFGAAKQYGSATTITRTDEVLARRNT